MINKAATCLAVFTISSFVMGCSNLSINMSDSDRTLVSDPGQERKHIASGDIAYRSGKTEDALVQYGLALEQNSSNPDTFYKIGSIQKQKNNLGLAKKNFDQAIKLDGAHLPSREALALVHLQKENFALATSMLQGVLELDKNRPEALNALAILFDMQEMYEKADQHYNRALILRPESARILNNLGYSYYLREDYPRAIQQFRKVLDTAPKFDRAWSNLALAYLRSGNPEGARRAFDQIVKKHQTLNNLGYLHLLLNNEDQARDLLNQSISKAPSYYPVAIQNLESLNSKQVTYATALASDRSSVGIIQETITVPASENTGTGERAQRAADSRILNIVN